MLYSFAPVNVPRYYSINRETGESKWNDDEGELPTTTVSSFFNLRVLWFLWFLVVIAAWMCC